MEWLVRQSIDVLAHYKDVIVLVLSVVSLLMFVLVIVLHSRASHLSKRIARMQVSVQQLARAQEARALKELNLQFVLKKPGKKNVDNTSPKTVSEDPVAARSYNTLLEALNQMK